MTVIFGPALAIAWSYAPRRAGLSFSNYHKQFFYATALVALPVLIATIAYLR